MTTWTAPPSITSLRFKSYFKELGKHHPDGSIAAPWLRNPAQPTKPYGQTEESRNDNDPSLCQQKNNESGPKLMQICSLAHAACSDRSMFRLAFYSVEKWNKRLLKSETQPKKARASYALGLSALGLEILGVKTGVGFEA